MIDPDPATPVIVEIWVVTYVDDFYADEFGSHVFLTQREAEEWADKYEAGNDPDSDGTEGTHLFTTITKHTVKVGTESND